MSKVLFTFPMMLVLGVAGLMAASQDTATPPKELVQYVRDARKAGLTEPQIQQNALTAGWPAGMVNDALATDKKPADKPADKPAAAAPDAANNAPATAPGSPAAKMAAPVDSLTKTPELQAKSPETTPAAAPASAPAVTPSAPANGTPAPASAPPGVGGVATGGAGNTPGVGGVKPSQPINRGVADDYEIGAGDLLHVNVWGEPTASVNGVVVRSDGKITLPLIHEIYVLGMTPVQAEKAIGEQLGRFLSAPDVAVIVGGVNSKKIYVTGQVKKEGTIAYTYRMTVMQAISEAGGLTPYAKKKRIYILRHEDGRDYKLMFDYDAVLRGEHMEMNIPLKPNDQLIVP